MLSAASVVEWQVIVHFCVCGQLPVEAISIVYHLYEKLSRISGFTMLEMRPGCERCDKDLAPDSVDVYICSFECTWCASCAIDSMQGICPNCGGGLRRRPPRAAHLLEQFPGSTTRVFKPVQY